ncbi:MAG: GntR family transcriptional regulator [Actinomycetota bacterium]
MMHVPNTGGPQAQPLTRTEWADGQLRAAILNGDVGPGDPLVISTLATQLGLSATPLREALRNLAAEGLVVLHSHGKARVAEIDIHEAAEIYDMRLMLEPEALARSVHNGDQQYRLRVEAAWDALLVARVAPASAHAAFHRELLSACDSRWLQRMATMLADRCGLMITAGVQSQSRSYNTAERHRVLKDLAVAGNADGASAELRRHLTGSIAYLSRLVSNDLTPAAAPGPDH